jgi:hypothetical protein
MDTQDTTGFEPNFGKFWPHSGKRQRNVVLHMAGGEQKARNYNYSIVAACHRVEPISKRRFGELDIRMCDVKLRPTCPNVRDELLKLKV